MTLYFIRATKTNLVKIGISDYFDSRLSKLRREGPDELIVLKVFHGDADLIKSLEADIHFSLKGSNHHKECFQETPEVQAYLVECKLLFNPENYNEVLNEVL